jgi:hypothetical protein
VQDVVQLTAEYQSAHVMAQAESLFNKAQRASGAAPVTEDYSAHGASLHGENAARRQAITELLFFSSVGDLNRCKKICRTWGVQVRFSRRYQRYLKRASLRCCWCQTGTPGVIRVVLLLSCGLRESKRFRPILTCLQPQDAATCDYDKRTPL